MTGQMSIRSPSMRKLPFADTCPLQIPNPGPEAESPEKRHLLLGWVMGFRPWGFLPSCSFCPEEFSPPFAGNYPPSAHNGFVSPERPKGGEGPAFAWLLPVAVNSLIAVFERA